MKKIAIIVTTLLVLVGCSTPKATTDTKIRVASHVEPMTTVVEIAKEELAKEGYELELVSVSDNTAANTALQNKEIDANFFQNVPYMQVYNEGNDANLVGITAVYDAKVGFYSKTISDLKDLPDNAKIAIPNDAPNQARALEILRAAGIVEIDRETNHDASLKDLKPNNYQWVEVALLTLNQAYEEVDLVFNYPTYIKSVGLTPKDALALEKSDGHYAITLVAREDNKNEEKIQKLKEAMNSEAVRAFLVEKNSETLVPSF